MPAVARANVGQPDPDRVRERGLTRFHELHALLEPRLECLLRCAPHTRDRRPGVPHVAAPNAPGVYLFTEMGNHRYVGRAKDLNARFGQHVAPKSHENQAAFAFNIATRDAEANGFPVAGRKRKALDGDQDFNERFFGPAKARVRAMEFRFVRFDPGMSDVDALSTIFEVYASLLLGTEGDFNVFATH